MNWETYEKKLLKNKEFRRIAEESEPEYQLARSLIAARYNAARYKMTLDSPIRICYNFVTKTPRINAS